MDFPYGLQDVTKALRQIFKIFDELAKRGGKIQEGWREHKRKAAAASLDSLRFKEGGMIQQLRQIAEGDYSEARRLGAKLDRTSGEVSVAISALDKYRRAIREQLSMETVMLLEVIIRGEGGKESVRSSLREIMYEVTGQNPQYAKFAAQNALRQIDRLNKNIVTLHDALISGKGIKKSRAKAEKAAPPAEAPRKTAKKAAKKSAAKAKS